MKTTSGSVEAALVERRALILTTRSTRSYGWRTAADELLGFVAELVDPPDAAPPMILRARGPDAA